MMSKLVKPSVVPCAATRLMLSIRPVLRRAVTEHLLRHSCVPAFTSDRSCNRISSINKCGHARLSTQSSRGTAMQPSGIPADFEHEGDEIPPQDVAETNSDADATFETDPALLGPPPVPQSSSQSVWAALTGNAVVFLLKLIVWARSGSPSMLAEAMHSLIDTANQALLALGLRQSVMRADHHHQYGYGKAAFVWGMISALGMFWAGGGVSVVNGLQTLTSGEHNIDLNWESWAVLGFSFAVDGAVLTFTARELGSRAAQHFPTEYPTANAIGKAKLIWRHMRNSSDPFLTAVALEDLAACSGVIIAAAGIGLSQWFQMPAFDSLASVAIGGMLGSVAVGLVRLNMRYLIGQSIDSAMTADIAALIRSFPSIDGVRYVQTQWLSPTTFLLSAKIDFDGTYLAAKLYREYEDLFLNSLNLQDDLPLILSFFAEDVTRLVEKELKDIEATIRKKHPGAALIELEPNSKESDVFIVRTMQEASRARAEVGEVLENHLAVLEALKKTKPEDPRIAFQEARINEWYRRRISSLAVRTTPGASAAGAPAPDSAPSSAIK